MEKKDFVNILLEERNYHSTHPNELTNKFFYTLGATLTTLVVGFIFRDKIDAIKCLVNNTLFNYLIAVIVIGYAIIIWGIYEHSKFHRYQLHRLESAIDYMLNPNNDFDFRTFWDLYGTAKFPTHKREDDLVKLIAKEPDTRKGIRFHDRKFEFGVLLILIGVLALIACLIQCSCL
jgi:hypothetical protein